MIVKPKEVHLIVHTFTQRPNLAVSERRLQHAVFTKRIGYSFRKMAGHRAKHDILSRAVVNQMAAMFSVVTLTD